jgi:hypothetical protein
VLTLVSLDRRGTGIVRALMVEAFVVVVVLAYMGAH